MSSNQDAGSEGTDDLSQNENENETDYLCTRAITGSEHPVHQAIFICETCQLLSTKTCKSDENGGDDDDEDDEEGKSEPLPSCICQSCAEICHANHQVYYVGVGPCTCDCPSMVHKEKEHGGTNKPHVCHLAAHSTKEARKMGFDTLRKLNDPIPLMFPPVATLLPVESMVDEDGTNDVEEKSDDENEGNNQQLESRTQERSHNEEDELNQGMSNMCMECHSSIGGYSFGTFTLPCLAEHDSSSENNEKEHSDDAKNNLCPSLIRQAEALTECSHDTFWMPMDDDDNDEGLQNQWCDLEILAKEIYNQHVQFYGLNKHGKGGGAEWWVQVKPAGAKRAPVDLHYDKDEVLAETFGLGSFPTLSTVTYLTGETNRKIDKKSVVTSTNDNAPTVVFPHTYNDDESQPIQMMILSHAVKGKHLVFDGRLLHGAPAHPALRRHALPTNATHLNDDENEDPNEDEGIESESSLRVTFLVNIWKTGRPAGVHILPESFRSKIRAASVGVGVSIKSTKDVMLREVLPLKFEKRLASQQRVASASGSANEKIVLPFVSHGATWIGGDEDDGEYIINADEENDEIAVAEEQDEVNSKGEGSDDDGDGDDDDEELVLVLPPLATPEYMADQADTIIFSFDAGNEARLVREGEVDEASRREECRWKMFSAAKKSEDDAIELKG